MAIHYKSIMPTLANSMKVLMITGACGKPQAHKAMLKPIIALLLATVTGDHMISALIPGWVKLKGRSHSGIISWTSYAWVWWWPSWILFMIKLKFFMCHTVMLLDMNRENLMVPTGHLEKSICLYYPFELIVVCNLHTEHTYMDNKHT